MAKKTKNMMRMTPVMSLAVLALFAMMIPLFSLANSQKRVDTSKAAPLVVVTPSPEASPDVMMKK